MGVFPKNMNELLADPHMEGTPLPRNAQNMYAVSFDLDTATLKQLYPAKSWENAYADIKKFLLANGFNWQQGSVYFGGDTINAVTCVMAVQALSAKYSWFKPSVKDIRMLRIEDFNDLAPAI